MKPTTSSLHGLTDTQGITHLVNSAHVVEILPQGGIIGNEIVVEVFLSNGRSICAEQLDLFLVQ